MLIISQDKNEIVNFDNITHVFIEGGSKTTIGCGKMSGCSETLGYYKTEARAKEVLQEIVSKYRHYNLDRELAVTQFPRVYEMPKE